MLIVMECVCLSVGSVHMEIDITKLCISVALKPG